MKKFALLSIITLFISKVHAQETSINTTGAPFLLIVSDARSGGMGDVGVATSSDAFSIHHNASKIAFNENETSIGINYTPWFRNLTDDIFIGGASYVKRFNENSGWAVDFKYFSLGEIRLNEGINSQGEPINPSVEKPNELALTGSYALKLSENFSMGVALKYIHSNYKIRTTNSSLEPVNSYAVDISGYYRSSEENYGEFNGRYRLGFNIANIGPKVNYTRTTANENFIPTNLKLGGGFDFIFDDYNTLGVNLEFTKLLVPSDSTKDWFEGMFSSFEDPVPTWALGAEYLYNKAFAVRAGYFNESEKRGNRQYFTMGAGFKARAFGLDISYLINSADIKNPLENTLRFSLAFDLGEIYEDY